MVRVHSTQPLTCRHAGALRRRKRGRRPPRRQRCPDRCAFRPLVSPPATSQPASSETRPCTASSCRLVAAARRQRRMFERVPGGGQDKAVTLRVLRNKGCRALSTHRLCRLRMPYAVCRVLSQRPQQLRQVRKCARGASACREPSCTARPAYSTLCVCSHRLPVLAGAQAGGQAAEALLGC
jgi:hypothetical protein